MDRERAIQFCHKYADKQFFQPIIFVPEIIEIQGKWHTATKDLVDLILPHCFGKSILDLGCMYGFFLHEAIKRGASRAVGVDHDAIEMHIAEEVNEIFDDEIELINEDLTKYIPDQSFDIVLMMNILHVLDDPAAIINRYLNLSTELVIEHRENHRKYFPRQPDWTADSLRSAGHRKLSCFINQGIIDHD